MLAILFICLIVFGAISLPIGIAMGLATMLCLVFATNIDPIMVAQNAFAGIDSFSLMAIPFFMLAGNFMRYGGISKRLLNLADNIVGFFTGGLGAITTFTAMFYAAISGSGPATVSAIGSFMIPEMEEKGYDKGYATALSAAAGTIGVIIPPSIPFVIYGVATGTSIGDLFKAGILPGLVMGIALMVYNWYICKRHGWKGNGRKFSVKALWKSFLDAFWAILSPVIILGGIYSGKFTPTEAAVVSVFYAVLVSLFVYKSIKVSDLMGFLTASVKTYGGLAFVLAFATAFGRVLSLTKATKVVEKFILGNFHTGWSALAVCAIIFLILGMVMDTGPAIIILAPVLLPAMEELGVDPVHFGVVLVCCLSIGLATPPFGLDMFVAGNISGDQPMSVARKSVPFIIAFLIALVLIVFVPTISTVLPNMLK